VGIFGKWWVGGIVRSSIEEKSKQGKASNGQASSSWGVAAMKSGDTIEEDENTQAEKILNRKKGTVSGGHSTKQQWNGQSSEPLQFQGVKPSGRRKKQAHKPRPAQILPGGEASAADRRPSDEVGLTAGSTPAPSAIDNTVFLQNQPIQPEQASLIATTPSTPVSTSDSGGGSAAAILEVQTQLDQVRLASETSRKQLQSQLEELRSRKRDEDAARLDVKGRMKTLDESKRQAEGTKREAERRLKAANGLREALENRIKAKLQEMSNWKAKESAHNLKVQESGEKKALRIEEIRNEILQKGQESDEAEEVIGQLKMKLERLQQRLLEEEANLEAARELAAERDAAVAAHRGYNSTLTSSPLYHNAYPLLSGPSELPEHLSTDMQIANGIGSLGPSSLHSGWDASNQAYENHGPTSGSIQVPLTSNVMKGEADFDDTFDPTIATSSPRNNPSPSGFAPFSFDQLAFQQGLLAQQGVQTPTGLFGEGANVPISPFTSDLLPSNLFQNADDDERHVGVLPGSRSERVEAALNRFGLDTSDTSDVEGALEGSADKEDDERASSFEGEPAESTNSNRKSTTRTWWGGRSRNASKDRTISNGGNVMTSIDDRLPVATASSDAILDSQPEGTKRRSLSIFPKLSLNPGAKSFRGGNKKVDVESSGNNAAMGIFSDFDDDRAMQALWSSSTGQVPTRQDFESMKRAFQTNNLNASQEDEDQGRRSWSAFDTWQQQQQNHASLSAANTGTGGISIKCICIIKDLALILWLKDNEYWQVKQADLLEEQIG